MDEQIFLTPASSGEYAKKFVTAVQICVAYRYPFALFSMPGQSGVRLMVDNLIDRNHSNVFPLDADGNELMNLDGLDRFFIGRFGGDEEYMAGVSDRLTLDEVLQLPREMSPDRLPLIQPSSLSTLRENYSRAFVNMRARLEKEGGKVVLSRVEAEPAADGLINNFRKLQAAYPDCFRYLCYTPSTGFWMGATPELLLEADKGRPYTFRTMALAGTAKVSDPSPWDAKNIEEQAIVADYIETCLKDLGLDVERSEPCDLTFGMIRHILTRFSAEGDVVPLKVLKALNPTPATLGFPVEQAYADIDEYETHNRYCYAGAVGTVIDGSLNAFVNLRCIFADDDKEILAQGSARWLYNFYAGGGLTALSDEETEWHETSMKIASTAALLDQPCPPDNSVDDFPAPLNQ